MLYIHVGLAKTGTTSLQRWCWEHSQHLAKNGYVYPKEIGTHAHAHHLLSHSLGGGWINTDGISEQEFGFMWSSLCELVSNTNKHIVISSERFSGAYDNFGISALYKVAEYVANSPVKIILYIRPVAEYVQSFYNQQLKTKRFTGSVEELYDQLADTRFNYVNIIDAYSTVFGKKNVIVRLMSTQSERKIDTISDFCSLLNIPPLHNSAGLNQDNSSLSLNRLKKNWQDALTSADDNKWGTLFGIEHNKPQTNNSSNNNYFELSTEASLRISNDNLQMMQKIIEEHLPHLNATKYS